MRSLFPLAGLSLALLSSSPSQAATTFVDVLFERSAWEAQVGPVASETFEVDIAQADVLDFASGIESVASGLGNDPANHRVSGGRFSGTLRTAGSSAPGYLTFVWTFPEPVTAFGADFFSIGGSREVSVQGSFDAGLESFDLRALFGADGGVDQGFFGIVSATPFSSITLVALGSIDSNDAFTVDDVVIGLPEPAGTGVLALAAVGLIVRLRRSPARPRAALPTTNGATGPRHGPRSARSALDRPARSEAKTRSGAETQSEA